MTHPSLKGSLRLLAGEWRGRGVADFPTIERVDYMEELLVEWDSGRDVLCYEQRVVLADGSPSHREVGFIRVLGEGGLELWNAQDNGRTEVLRGSGEWNDSAGELAIVLESVTFGNDPRMVGSKRELRLGPSQLTYEVAMSTTTAPDAELRLHLRAQLDRTVVARSG